jgi:hypothetical protein
MHTMRWELVICVALVGCASSGGSASNAHKTALTSVSVASENLVNEVPGRLTREHVRRVVLAHDRDVRACYAVEASTNPTLQGGLDVSWEILPDGSVSAPMLSRSTLDNPRLEECVLNRVRGWRFPPSDSQTTVASFSFRFPR